MNAATERLLCEHAGTLLALGRLYDAIGCPEAFTRVAAEWPLPGEVECSPDDVSLGVRRFNEQVGRARRARSGVESASGRTES